MRSTPAFWASGPKRNILVDPHIPGKLGCFRFAQAI